MTQGNHKVKKPQNSIKKKKPVRGDQQKLRKGNFVIAPKPNHLALHSEYVAQQNISKSINGRIEQTMAGRGAGDGGGLKLVQSDAPVAKSGLGRSGKAKAAAKKEKKKSGRGK